MIMNVPAAPDMQGTPMTPDLSGQMQPEMGEVSQAEIQEAQGALTQIIQVINMLVQQGLNEDQIMEFLAQYGITEEELDQAAQLLGVDIDALIGGQMQAPQEPMMMADGGPSMSDNSPMMQDMSPRQRMFSIDATIENLLKQYDISVNTGNIQDAMAISEEITNLNNQKIAISEQLDPVMMAKGGGASTSIDPSYIPEYLQMLENQQAELFNLTRKAPGINPTGLSPDMSLAKRRQQFETAKKNLRQATRALNPEVFEIYEAGQFRKLPTAFSKGAIEDYINFVNQKKQTEKKKLNSPPDLGSITPISPFEMTEAFGGPLYQMLNPGAQQLVDRFGLRGQGLSGAAAMAFGPKKIKGGLTTLDDLTRSFLAKEKTRLEGVIASIKKGTDPILKKENLAIYQKQLDNVNDEIAENIRLRKQYDEMVKDPSKFFKTKD